MHPTLHAENIEKSFRLEGRTIKVLHPISLAVQPGEFVALAGSSGSGKSTLLSLLAGLDRPDAGRVTIGDTEITHLSEDRLAPVRNRETGFVFQAFHLIPSLSALENVMFPAELAGDSEALPKAQQLLERVGLGHRTTSFPTQMSGGEQQRCAICRAIINRPRLLFADEPTGNLDSRNSDAITRLLEELHREQGMSLLIATHSASLADRADRVIRLHDGKVEAP